MGPLKEVLDWALMKFKNKIPMEKGDSKNLRDIVDEIEMDMEMNMEERGW